MTSFVHVDYPQQHPGVARAEAVMQAAGRLRQGFDGTRGIAALLLAGVVSALLVLADRLVDSWGGGRLMAAWLVLWLVAFAALALFATPARRLANALVQRLDAWSQHVASQRADDRLWATAQTDARVMADLKAAMSRSDAIAPRAAAALFARESAGARISLRDVMQGWYRDVQKARADVAYLTAVKADPRMLADLQAAATRAESVPAQTQTLLRGDSAGNAMRDAAHALGARRSYYF
ncbi:hypothetical protein [Pseudorhodoferax soli]|uniref:Uncharacterized protein n=1 Tax=Pseudorhodoferax soli TaxID=545864 RepID=A0A368XI28_9BURK|nr:hypothetical protein DES41_110201 [Pseudorhodoferax soli]